MLSANMLSWAPQVAFWAGAAAEEQGVASVVSQQERAVDSVGQPSTPQLWRRYCAGRLDGTLLGVESIPSLPLSTEGQAHRLIAEATDHEKLGQVRPRRALGHRVAKACGGCHLAAVTHSLTLCTSVKVSMRRSRLEMQIAGDLGCGKSSMFACQSP